MDKWDELKEHVQKQLENCQKNDNNVSRLVGHVWTDVKNKMWSLEQK